MGKNIISKELLEILACPQCKTDLRLVEYRPDTFGLQCIQCKKIYPIEDGIPVMLIDEAIQPDS